MRNNDRENILRDIYEKTDFYSYEMVHEDSFEIEDLPMVIDEPENILEAEKDLNRDKLSVFEYEPRLRDKIMNYSRIGEKDGFMVNYTVRLKSKDWKNNYFHRVGLIPKQDFGKILEILEDNSYTVEAPVPDTKGTEIIIDYDE